MSLYFQSHGEVNSVSDLEVVSQLNMIRDKILAKADPQLHNHLIKLDIPLPLFGMYVHYQLRTIAEFPISYFFI